jgi:sugar phosphate isomerase/epimerase
MMKLGVYSLVAPDYEIEPAAELIADIGYTGVEWTLDYGNAVWDESQKWHISTEKLDETVEAANAATAERGLTTLGLGARTDCFDPGAVRQALEICARMGGEGVRVHAAGYGGDTHIDKLMEQSRAAFKKLLPVARDTGVKIWVELHNGRIVASASATRRLLEGMDPDCIGAILDPGNMLREGMENWQMGCELLGPYLQHVHVKNYVPVQDDAGNWQYTSSSLEEGLVDWEAVVAALKSVGYQGYLNIEDFRGGYGARPEGITTRDKLQEDYDYLSNLL